MSRYAIGLFFLLIIAFNSCNTHNQGADFISSKNLKVVSFYGSDTVCAIPDTLFAGTMNEGETSVNEFIVENKTPNTISIKKIDAGCGCTTFKWHEKPIEPYGKEIITISYNSSGQYGKQFRPIKVCTEQSEERIIFFAADVNF